LLTEQYELKQQQKVLFLIILAGHIFLMTTLLFKCVWNLHSTLLRSYIQILLSAFICLDHHTHPHEDEENSIISSGT